MESGGFPIQRLRRLRRSPRIRDAVADVAVHPDDLILPLFVSDLREPKPVASMPGVSQLPVDTAVSLIRGLATRGLRQFILFGVTPPARKNGRGNYAVSPEAPVNRTLAAVRQAGLDVLMYADLCLCEYTDHGHCGVIHSPGEIAAVDNDRTLEVLGEVARTQAQCGADVVAPSGMMDGQVGAVRTALDQAGFSEVAILAYSIKYASNFYGPFREAGEGGMKFGDRKGYQMDFRRSREWLTELEADLAQGADMVMVKPAATYLDIVNQVRHACSVPVAAYHVSGEYAMLLAAADRGWLDLKPTVLETTYAIKRAGADLIVTYFADRLLDWL
jgi:porphobilinogen synthase